MTTTHTTRPQASGPLLGSRRPAPVNVWLKHFDAPSADFKIPAGWGTSINALPRHSQAAEWLAQAPWMLAASFVSKNPVDGTFLVQTFVPSAQRFAVFGRTGKLISEGGVDLNGRLSIPLTEVAPITLEEPGLSADPNDWLKVGTMQVFEQLGAFERALRDGKVNSSNAKVYREAIARLRGELGREGAAYSDVLPPNLMLDKLYGRPDHRYKVQSSLRRHLQDLERRITQQAGTGWVPSRSERQCADPSSSLG